MSHGANTVHGASRPDTIVNFGFWVYLMSDVILFSMLFTMFVVVSDNTFGGPGGEELFKLRDVFFETMALLFSSITFGFAMLSMHAKHKGGVLLWLLVTFIFGVLFITLELHEFYELVHEGATPQASAFLSAFFTLVGTHGTHVSLEDWERSALQRQYTTPAGFRVLVDKVEEDGPARKSGGRGARLGA